MKPFKELASADEIIDYQKRVLSRTGGRKADEAQLYHYSNILALKGMLDSGFMWLSPVDRMNDVLEAEMIRSAGIKDMNFACFSRTNQSIAMFKMYAPNPNGVMISISVSDAKRMLELKPRLVENDMVRDEVDIELYWMGVCYKDIETETITTPGQRNSRIKKPLKELAGAVKLSGWDYEKEVRLCGRMRLYPEQRLAVKLPERINVTLCPGFDRESNRSILSKLIENGIRYEESKYEGWIRT